MLARLIALFAGKPVRITHTGTADQQKVLEGICKTVHAQPGSPTTFNIELYNGMRIGFMPDRVTQNFADGRIADYIVGRHKVEVVALKADYLGKETGSRISAYTCRVRDGKPVLIASEYGAFALVSIGDAEIIRSHYEREKGKAA